MTKTHTKFNQKKSSMNVSNVLKTQLLKVTSIWKLAIMHIGVVLGPFFEKVRNGKVVPPHKELYSENKKPHSSYLVAKFLPFGNLSR